ncbi:MAG: glycosyltransferase family 39 protein, partial [Acidobacteria bacterium]
MMSFLRRHAGLIAVLLLGVALRFGALDYGLPRHNLGQDEIVTYGRVQRGALRGTAMAPTYNWPNLNIHLSNLAIAVARPVEKALGLPRHDVMWIGRAMVATLCTLSLFWLYLAAARLFDRRVGVMSAAFLAVMPLHVFRSRMWVPDAPMTAFYILALLAAVWILEKPSTSRFVWAGVAIGLATSAKYNGAGACLPVVVAAVMARDQMAPARWWGVLKGLLVAGVVSVVTFFVVDPLALGHLEELFRGAFWVGDLYRDKPPTGFLGWHVMRYVAVAFYGDGYEGVGPFISLLSVAGGVVLLRRRSKAAVLVLLPPLLYLVLYSAVLRTTFERVFMPLLPHMAIAAGVASVTFAVWLEKRVRRQWREARVVGLVLIAAVLVALPPAAKHTWAARHGETRLEALGWMRSNLPPSTRILREWNMLRPPLVYFDTNKRDLLLCKTGMTVEEMAERYDYVVASSSTYDWVFRQRPRPGFDARADFYDELFDSPHFELAARFEPDLTTFGPEIRVYRSLQERGARVAGDEVELAAELWGNTDALERQKSKGTFIFTRYRDLV